MHHCSILVLLHWLVITCKQSPCHHINRCLSQGSFAASSAHVTLLQLSSGNMASKRNSFKISLWHPIYSQTSLLFAKSMFWEEWFSPPGLRGVQSSLRSWAIMLASNCEWSPTCKHSKPLLQHRNETVTKSEHPSLPIDDCTRKLRIVKHAKSLSLWLDSRNNKIQTVTVPLMQLRVRIDQSGLYINFVVVRKSRGIRASHFSMQNDVVYVVE